MSHKMAKKQVCHKILPLSWKWRFRRTSSNIEQHPLLWPQTTLKVKNWLQTEQTKGHSHKRWSRSSYFLKITRNCSRKQKNKSLLRRSIVFILTCKTCRAKNFTFLRILTLQKKVEHIGSMRKKGQTGYEKELQEIWKLRNPKLGILSPIMSHLVKNNRKDIDSLNCLLISWGWQTQRKRGRVIKRGQNRGCIDQTNDKSFIFKRISSFFFNWFFIIFIAYFILIL